MPKETSRPNVAAATTIQRRGTDSRADMAGKLMICSLALLLAPTRGSERGSDRVNRPLIRVSGQVLGFFGGKLLGIMR
jgi:hypothetical protein